MKNEKEGGKEKEKNKEEEGERERKGGRRERERCLTHHTSCTNPGFKEMRICLGQSFLLMTLFRC